jgi:hypothetical protein
MSADEIVFRLRRAVFERFESQFSNDLSVPVTDEVEGAAIVYTVDAEIPIDEHIAAADRLLNGETTVFAIESVPFPPAWNTDPKTGRTAPQSFGKGIDYRREDLVGDIKYLWEPNRHAELVTLAQAWRVTNDHKYLHAIGRTLDDWLDACPYPLGPNWTSSLELALRLVNWSLTWHLIDGLASPLFADQVGKALRDRWRDAVYRHLDFIAGHLSLFSSANNHLLGEYLGLFVGASTWPAWPETERWRSIGKRGFEQEALLQTAADGVNREQAVSYQQVVMDMMLIAGLTARANGNDFTPAFWERLECMCAFLHALMDVNGKVPMIGDSDDARIVRLDPDSTASPYHALMAAGAILFGRGDFAAKVKTVDTKTRWLFPNTPLPQPALAPPSPAFVTGGYFLLGEKHDTPHEVRIVCDCGPLGYLSLAAHGHADALSFTLSADGYEWIVDPGTFAYHTEKLWRDHFRGTGAHNTVRIDGLDQSEIGGNFLWSSHANARLIAYEPLTVFEGEHDGYLRLADPVGHHRRLVFNSAQRSLQIVDTLTCRATHQIEIGLQFAETCSVEFGDGRVLASQKDAMLEAVCLHPDFVAQRLHGSSDPPGGWVSRSFDTKIAATMVRWSGVITGTTVVETELRFLPPHPNFPVS